MAFRKLRAPRAGEVALFLAQHCDSAKPELWQTGPQIRYNPSPCCRKTYKGGGAGAISPTNGLWKCMACNAKGNFFWLSKLFGDPLSDPYEDTRPVDLAPYSPLRAKARRPVTGGHYPELLEICHGRGFTDATLDAFRVTTCGPKSLRWPIYAYNAGRIVMANARIRHCVDRDTKRLGRDGHELPNDWFEVRGGPALAIGNHLLGVEPRLWIAEKPAWASSWIDPSRDTPEWRQKFGPFSTVRRVLVTEGQWDAMTAWQLGIPNVLSLPNGASAVDVGMLLRYVPEDAEVWIASDMDEAGKKCAELFFAQVAPNRLARVLMPAKDLNAWYTQDPNLSAEMILRAARGVGAGRIEPKTEPRWLDLSEPEKAEGTSNAWGDVICETPWPRLTTRLGGGVRACQTMGVLAPSGVGKTTFLNNVVAHAAALGVRCGMVQVEGARTTVRSKLRAQVIGWVGTELGADELKQVFARIRLSPLEGKETTVDQTLDELERLAEDGCKILAIDNWDYLIDDGMSGERAKVKAYGRFQKICRDYGAHGITVWQPAKVDRNEEVNSGSQKGLSRFFQDADVYLNLNKFGVVRRAQVEKARVEGVDDSAAASDIWLKYDRERCCLFETDGQGLLRVVGKSVIP